MNDSYYELGRDVTHLVASGNKKETSVISVRLTINEIKRLEKIGRESDKTVSQVIRYAIAAYRIHRPETVVGLWNGSAVTVGEPEEASGNARCEVNYSDPESDPTGKAHPIQP